MNPDLPEPVFEAICEISNHAVNLEGPREGRVIFFQGLMTAFWLRTCTAAIAPETIEDVDAFAARMSVKTGRPVTRSRATNTLLAIGLGSEKQIPELSMDALLSGNAPSREPQETGDLFGPGTSAPAPPQSEPYFTCSSCGAVSHNPNDKVYGWCGRCGKQTAPQEERP